MKVSIHASSNIPWQKRYAVAFTNFDQINEKVSDPINRLQWAYNMAYTQWNKKEIINGDAWDHLKRYYDQN